MIKGDISENKTMACGQPENAQDISSTVQTFNCCTSRPDVCQRLVVQKIMDNVKSFAKDTNDTRSLRINATFSCEVIQASMSMELDGIWAFSAGIKCRTVECPYPIFPSNWYLLTLTLSSYNSFHCIYFHILLFDLSLYYCKSLKYSGNNTIAIIALCPYALL